MFGERMRLASAQPRKHFLPERIFEFRKIQTHFAVIAQNFQNGRLALFRYPYVHILYLHDVHLQSFYQEISFVSAAATSQRHCIRLLSAHFLSRTTQSDCTRCQEPKQRELQSRPLPLIESQCTTNRWRKHNILCLSTVRIDRY